MQAKYVDLSLIADATLLNPADAALRGELIAKIRDLVAGLPDPERDAVARFFTVLADKATGPARPGVDWRARNRGLNRVRSALADAGISLY